jgi:hypothetical protein
MSLRPTDRPVMLAVLRGAYDRGVMMFDKVEGYGGFGLRDSFAEVGRLAPQARLVVGFALQVPQEGHTAERATGRLEQGGPSQ